MSYSGQTAYVTGGASGIGRNVAHMVVSKGVKVFVADRNLEGARAVVKELNEKANGEVAWAVQVDVTDWDSQRAGFEAAVKTLGRIDYVYPIAGIAETVWLPNRTKATTFEKPDLSVLDVDATGVFFTIALATQQFRNQEPGKFGFRGKIVTVSSVRGLYAVPSMPIYCAAKFAVVGFVRAWGKQLVDEKITVNAVCPGILRTGIAIGANDWYGEAEKLNLIVKMESLLNAFSYLLGDNPTSGECFEIPPGKIDNPEGWVIKEQTPFTTPESEVHAAYSNKQFSHLHAPIAE